MSTNMVKRLENLEQAVAALASEAGKDNAVSAERQRILESQVAPEDRAAFCALYRKLRDGIPFDESDKAHARKYRRVIILLAEGALARMQTCRTHTIKVDCSR